MITHENRDGFDQYRRTVQTVNGFRGDGLGNGLCGAGQRVIILNIRSEVGFLTGCMKCFVGKRDQQITMNKQHFDEWLRFVFTVISDKSVIVFDQAPHQTTLDSEYRNPTTSWRKIEIVLLIG